MTHPIFARGSAVLVACFIVGCKFYTACPSGQGAPGGNNGQAGSGGDGAGGGAGTSGTSGSAGSSGDGGVIPGEWVNVSSNLAGIPSECGNMSNLSAKPDEDLLIAGIALKGLYGSRDGGLSWQPLGTGAGSAQIANRTSQIVYDPTNSQRFWESGIYDGPAVYVTEDDGVTFTQLGDITHRDSVSIDFTDPDRKTLVSGSHERTQTVDKSGDGGGSWTPIGGGLPADAYCTEAYVVDAQTYLIGCGDSIYRTIDGGTQWSQVSAKGGSKAPLLASDGSLYWAGGGLQHSTDQGKTWASVVGSEGAGDVTPLELPDHRLATLAGNAVVVSDDAGASWHAVSPDLPYGDSVGVVYSSQQKAFFIWHFTCGFNGPVPVPDDAIMRFDWDYTQ